jgi:hypothetical protein
MIPKPDHTEIGTNRMKETERFGFHGIVANVDVDDLTFSKEFNELCIHRENRIDLTRPRGFFVWPA